MRTDEFGKPVVAKTGLGSSAALVTSLVACLLQSFGVVDLSASADKQLVHNLAQVAHCLAQGKVSAAKAIGTALTCGR